MENDSIRPSGSNTLVEIWIDGKLRAISISREAIESYVGFNLAEGMTENDRCEFVRTHLPLIVRTAAKRLQAIGSAADQVTIDAGDFPSAGQSGDRRKVELRKGERRQADRPERDLAHGERRRSDRRKNERRRPPAISS